MLQKNLFYKCLSPARKLSSCGTVKQTKTSTNGKRWRGLETRKPAYTAGGSVTGAATKHNSREAPYKLKTELPHAPAIPLPGMHPQKTVFTPVFPAALFSTAKTQTQAKCHSTDGCMKRRGTHLPWTATQP